MFCRREKCAGFEWVVSMMSRWIRWIDGRVAILVELFVDFVLYSFCMNHIFTVVFSRT